MSPPVRGVSGEVSCHVSCPRVHEHWRLRFTQRIGFCVLGGHSPSLYSCLLFPVLLYSQLRTRPRNGTQSAKTQQTATHPHAASELNLTNTQTHHSPRGLPASLLPPFSGRSVSFVRPECDQLQVQFRFFIRDNPPRGAVKVHLDTKTRVGRSAAVQL